MKRFLVCVLLFLALPMVLLNPLGREAFLGYYAGIFALWAVLVGVGTWRREFDAWSTFS